MAAEPVVGSVRVQFRGEDHLCVIERSDESDTTTRISDTTETIAGTPVPTWVEITTSGGVEPDRYVRVELRDGAPQLVKLAWTSHPDQREIRQKHYRDLDLTALVTDVVSGAFWIAPERPADPLLTYQEQTRRYVEQIRTSKRMAAKFIERQRRPQGYRAITDDLLRSVADVYRSSIDHAPRKAVALHFQVTERMASTYVEQARKKGLLPPTKQGQKKA